MRSLVILLYCEHCVHGSSVNTSKTLSRMVYTTCCIPKGEKFLSGKNAKEKYSV